MHLVKKKVKGISYYSIAETKRVKGKPKTTIIKYLGNADKILRMALGIEEAEMEYTRVYDFGDVAALYLQAEDIQLQNIIDRHARKRNQGLTVGQHILLIVLNRAVEPKSKRGIARWYRKTVLPRLTQAAGETLNSQNFWNHMGYLESKEIKAIEKDITSLLVKEEVPLDTLLYDITNFATYIQDHEEDQLPRRGNNKQKRFDLNQINLALLVTREDGIPLFHEAYEGNMHDAKKFPQAVSEVVGRLREMAEDVEDITLVFDKGNNSKKNLTRKEFKQLHFVGSLKPSNYKTLLDIPLKEFKAAYERPGKKKGEKIPVLAKRLKQVVMGAERTVVITYDEATCKKNKATFLRNLEKTNRELQELESKIGTHKNKSKEAIKEKAEKIVSRKAVKGLFQVKVREDHRGIQLKWKVDGEAVREREKKFGKSILFTDQHGWSTEEIIRAYRSKNVVEEDFKVLTSGRVPVLPMWHWTDDKIRVHVFCCVMALLLLRLIQKKLKTLDMSLERTMEELHAIKEVEFKFKGMDRVFNVLTEMSPLQKKLYENLGLEKARVSNYS